MKSYFLLAIQLLFSTGACGVTCREWMTHVAVYGPIVMADLVPAIYNGEPRRMHDAYDQTLLVPFPPGTEFVGGATWSDPAYYVKVEREFTRGVIRPSFGTMSSAGPNFQSALGHLHAVLDDYVARGVVDSTAAEELRQKQAKLSPERTILFAFRTPDNAVTATLALIDGSRYPGEYGGLFTTGYMGPYFPTSPPQIQIEMALPDLVLPERTAEGEAGDVYELIRLDGSDGVIGTIPAGLAAAAHWIAHKYGDHTSEVPGAYRAWFIPKGGVYAVYPDERKYVTVYEGKFGFVPFELGRKLGGTPVRIGRKNLFDFVRDAIGYPYPPLRVRSSGRR